jgi:heat shock protein HslJ
MKIHTPAFAARFATLALALPLSLVLLASVGCQSTGQSAGHANPPGLLRAVCLSKLVPSEWTCTQLGQHTFPEGAVSTIAFAGTEGDSDNVQVSGFAGVNRFFGPLKQTDGALVFGPLVTTRMGGSPERMELEPAYLEMLLKVEAAWIDGNTLRPVDGIKDDSAVLATFRRPTR